MCEHALKYRTDYNTEVCASCGLEVRVDLTILQARPPMDMTPFPVGYSRSKRFAKLLDGVLYPTPSCADDGMFEYLFLAQTRKKMRFDTIGGLVYKELGKMPEVGDHIEVDSLTITVQSTIGRRIGKLKLNIPSN